MKGKFRLITNKQIKKIKAKIKAGVKLSIAATNSNVSYTTVWKVKSGYYDNIEIKYKNYAKLKNKKRVTPQKIAEVKELLKTCSFRKTAIKAEISITTLYYIQLGHYDETTGKRINNSKLHIGDEVVHI